MRGALVLLLIVPALAGCLSSDPSDDVSVPDPDVLDLPFQNGTWSQTLSRGPHDILEPLSVFFDVDLPATEGADAGAGAVRVHMGVFLPDVPEGTPVPVIADIGPYYQSSQGRSELNDGSYVVGESDTVATEPADRLGRFLIENFVPHGYAVAQVSVLGTGDSTACQDLMGRSEQAGVQAAVEALGTAEWSNGNVGLIGRSYDGSTPWQAAMVESEHLKTIVPISGLTGVHNLMYHNGSAEERGAGVLYALYAAMTIDGTVDDATQVLCPDYLAGPAQGAGATVTGDFVADAANPYWTEREFMDEVLAHYDGSVYLIHGMQDWNVDPHVALGAYELLEANGNDVKALLGQWDHAYPDRWSDHSDLRPGRGAEAFPNSVRLDWAQDLLAWFDHYLKGGAQPDLHVEIQDNQGAWRIESTYPPADAAFWDLDVSDLEARGDPVIRPASAQGNGIVDALNPLPDDMRVYDEPFVLALPSLESETRIVGQPLFHVDVIPGGPGGQLYVQMRDVTDGIHLGHAIMDLRFAAGGVESSPVVPSMPLTARMQFEPMDVVVPAGHDVELWITATGEDYLPSVSAPVVIDGGVLRLPTIERGAEDLWQPPTPLTHG